MADKVQLIKEEIESYKESMKGLEPHSDFRKGQITAFNQIMQFIDSIPEESTDEVNCTPKSDDLKEAAFKYRCEHRSCDAYTIDAFKAGAEWQKDKMNLLLQTEYEKGLFDMNEAMMKDAVELRIVESFNPVGTENEKPHGFTALCYNAKYPDFYPVTGQTIKVVPIKEIQQNEQDCRKKGFGSISNSF